MASRTEFALTVSHGSQELPSIHVEVCILSYISHCFITHAYTITLLAGYKVCRDPGIPQNGLRRAPSFGHGHMASFGCQRGFKREGSHLRVCEANDPINVHWTGVPVTCKSKKTVLCA